VTVGIAFAVSVTLVPALLATVGRLAFWPRRIAELDGAAADPHPDAPPTLAGRLIVRRPVAALTALVCVAALVAVAWPVQHLHLGFGQISDLPTSTQERQASHEASRGFANGILSPTTVLVQGRQIGTSQRAQLDGLQTLIGREPGVAAVLGPADEPGKTRFGVFVSRTNGAARYVVVFRDDPLGARGIQDMQRLRSDMPALAQRAGLQGARLSYTGDTALADETIGAVRTDMLRVAIVVLLVNLILLAIFLRSVMAPLLLLGSSVLTVAATLGATTWLFQDILHYEQLTYYVPFAIGVLLVSLGSDYNVFVVGRIWQEARVRPLRQAVGVAAPQASKTIRIAGLTLAATFAILALIPLRSFRELAFAMALGVLLETFVARALLAPALIALFGRYSAWPRRHDADSIEPGLGGEVQPSEEPGTPAAWPQATGKPLPESSPRSPAPG
jgi:RND superfamily putative drug exporter